jgi:carboxyl-terminal processing protease
MKEQTKIKSFLPIIICSSICVGILIGYSISSYQFATSQVQIASKKFRDIFKIIESEYADSVEIEDLYEKSIKNTLAELDPHSSYIPNKDLVSKTNLDSEISGIGIKYAYLRDTLFVTESIKKGPAFLAGIKNGDRILAVNGTSIVKVEDQSIFAQLLRGKKGTSVQLLVYRKTTKKELKLEIERNEIPFEAVDLSYMVNAKTGYLKLNRFSEESGNELHKQLIELKKKGMKQLILDLRDNGGGYYEAAVQICDEFLPQGRNIVYTQSREVVKDKEMSKLVGEFEYQNLIVLINENSASASEIVASALQDNDRAVLVGRRSFGKALVQSPYPLFDGSEVRITTARYYSPSGRCIQKPYSMVQNYKSDIKNRAKTGELIDEEKIFKNDSLKYHTRNNRTVFGGGGVYPDVFIALDTSLNHPILTKMLSEFYFLEYGIKISQLDSTIEKMGLDAFSLEYKVSDAMLQDYINFCQKEAFVVSKKDQAALKMTLKREIKIYLAEAIWGTNGMYRMANLNDSYLTKSLEIFPTIGLILNPSKL